MPREKDLRVVVIAEDVITSSALHALLAGQEHIEPVAVLVSGERQSIPAYDPDVLLWDVGWTSVGESQQIVATDFSGPGRIAGTPLLALVSSAAQIKGLWNIGVRSALLRSVSPQALLAALHATSAGLWTLSPPLAGSAGWIRTGETSISAETLTDREGEVLNLVAEGLTNRAIAQRLSISEHTVKFHLNSILGKLDAESRTDAVVRATRAGLIFL